MDNQHRTGFLAGLSAYLIWGLLPIYWKALGVVPPLELLAWRIAGCGVVAWAFLLARKKPVAVSTLNRTVVIRLVLAALLISINWGLYIWAVAAGKIVQASLGYFINPLVNVVLGVLFFSEKLGRIRLFALGLATIGVVLMTFDTGAFPWISIVLALLFGFYGTVVKTLPKEMDSIEILGWETILLSPIAAAYLVWLGFSGNLNFTGHGFQVWFMLLFSGVVTLVPLWLFGAGARRIALSAMGFMQYIAPTMMLLLGVLAYGEAFGAFKAAAFGLVVAALVLYSITLKRSHS